MNMLDFVLSAFFKLCFYILMIGLILALIYTLYELWIFPEKGLFGMLALNKRFVIMIGYAILLFGSLGLSKFFDKRIKYK